MFFRTETGQVIQICSIFAKNMHHGVVVSTTSSYIFGKEIAWIRYEVGVGSIPTDALFMNIRIVFIVFDHLFLYGVVWQCLVSSLRAAFSRCLPDSYMFP